MNEKSTKTNRNLVSDFLTNFYFSNFTGNDSSDEKIPEIINDN